MSDINYVQVPEALYYQMEAAFLERIKFPSRPITSVTLTAHGEKFIGVIKCVRTHTGLGLGSAKRVVEALPQTFRKEDLHTGYADPMREFVRELRELGATVEEVRA